MKGFLGQNIIWVLLALLGQLHGYTSCVQEERKALWEIKKYMIPKSLQGRSVLPTWTNDTKSNCCRWNGVECNRSSGRVIGISFGKPMFKERFLLNLSLLHPFEEVRILNFSWHGLGGNQFSGFFDDVEEF
ncbi:unnamed protein product [Thlaspi arvense]|uniref:Leucine-rich repeat-containing N-terminal plant-type domain-containing protein n=1 Tax=Thlaspi arvense TaxID=13288 RepID=A0AAU9SGK0_THLAR|nr:unnamed protein product [Thlaspi arvense]